MRISADCIDQEVDIDDREHELSRDFSRMDLNERSGPQNDNELTGDEIRVIYKVNYSSDDSTAIASLSVIPVTDYHKTGYFSEWHEVKQQIIDLSFKDKSEVPKGLQFVALIKALEYELEVNSREDYFTALKVAEIYGQPLDVMIKTSLEPFASQLEDTVNQSSATASQASENKVTDRQSSSEANKESIDSNNGFVMLNSAQKCDTSSNQSSDNRLVVMDERQIEKIKKEITIDVTKRLITKLNECLTDLTNETTAQSKDYKTEYVVGEERGESLPKVVHKGIICDNCDKQIEGIRYKCINCVDYDLCEPCKQKPVHYPNHTFNKIERYIRGIPKQTLPPTLDFLKPFLSGATIDPNTRDVVLTLDVDLTNGTISKTNVSPTAAAAPHNDATNQMHLKAEEPKCDSNKKSSSDDDVSGAFGPHMPQKRYCSEKRAKQITKKLEKLKQKSYFYNQLLSTSDDRSSTSALDRSKPTTSGAIVPNPSLVSNKTLYLSGLLIGDETIPEGTRMPPNTKFRKTWKVRNTGTKVWSGRTTLRFVWGHPELEPFGKVTEVQAPTLRPGEEGKVTIRFTSPNTKTLTRYQSYWRLHHRGQPFGPRLVVKIVVDPMAVAITPTPTPLAPILSKESRNSVNAVPPRPPATARPLYPWLRPDVGVCSPAPVYQLNETTCNLEAVSHIQQSIFESQRNISDKLLAMSTNIQPPTQSDATQPTSSQKKEKTQKTSAKRLTEALSQVKELRFDLDENETIPMKSNVKSHTTTPANTPFDVSPPKSPEPTTSSASFGELQTHEKTEKSDENEIEVKLIDDKNDNESDGESLDVLSLSSGNESSDEFVLVPFPKCFDLNVPFAIDTEIIGNDENNQNNIENNFEVINNANDASGESDDDNTRQETNDQSEESQPTQPLQSEPNEEALDLTKERPQTEEQTQSKETESQSGSQSSTASDAEPQLRNGNSSPSTNPFRNSGNDGENVIHVLPESIVTGALSAAAHVYNNVSRALFSRNEGTNFAWVTSPPPAALPLPNMYWDDRTGQYPPSPGYYGPNVHSMATPSAPQMQSAATPDHQPQAQAVPPPPPPPPSETASRVSSALKQLYEMGFWNQKLNQELLAKNGYDVNDTIEDLLSPDKNRHSRNGNRPNGAAEPVVSHQPRNSRNGFIDEFD